MKTTITQAERLQLIGLLTLAKHHNRMLQDIHVAAAALLGCGPVDERGNALDDPSDHVGDAVSGSREPDDLLRVLHIVVEPAEASTS